MLDLTKPVQTRDGRRAQIFSHDGGTAFPILGAVESAANQGRPAHWNLQRWTPKGVFYATDAPSHGCDLVNVPQRIHRRVWVNVYNDVVCIHQTRELADLRSVPAPWVTEGAANRLACIPFDIDCCEGEGL